MLQLNYIRQNAETVRQKLAVRNFKESELVEEILRLDEERRKLQSESEQIQSKLNSAAKEIGQLMSKGAKGEAENKKAEVANLKSSLQPVLDQLTSLEKQVQDTVVRLPNLPHDKVPAGKTPEDNVVVREGGKKPDLPATAVPHWELIRKYDIVDFETGAKITGSGFPLYKGTGARLQRALIQYFLDYNTKAGYTEYLPPLMVNEATAYGTGQLPDKEGQMYHITEDEFYLIPTAEVPLTNIYRDEVLKEADLPVKMTGYTPCFRREAGSFGKDVRGLNRVHQFDKVEIVQ
ncbi:MAG TPA: aminoacyl--tRNA ligase-related protein, partial [Flavitalea sp.]|nr:aminoacyl--tRNA ligase-related protein [Flavitalea sp.]